MNIAQIKIADTANGPGMRVTVFVSGCENHCKGCFQPETWDYNYGIPYGKDEEQMILDEVKKDYYQGLTLLGGDPMEFCNQYGILPLIKKFKEQNPDKDLWIYTGYHLEDLLDGGKRNTEITDDILKLTDVLVDGPFILEEKDITLKFRGSRNQRLLDLQKTLENKKAVLLSE